MRDEIIYGGYTTKRGIYIRYKIYRDDSIEVWQDIVVRAKGGYKRTTRFHGLTNELRRHILAKHNINVK